jgi:hypothetical protein
MFEGLFLSMIRVLYLMVVFQNLLSLDNTVDLSVQLDMNSSLSTISLTHDTLTSSEVLTIERPDHIIKNNNTLLKTMSSMVYVNSEMFLSLFYR